MKKTTWFKLDSPRRQKQKQNVDGLAELVSEKDEILMRRPFQTTTTTSQTNKSANFLLSGTNSSTGTHPHHMKNDFCFGLFPKDQLFQQQQQLVNAKLDEGNNYKTSQVKWPFPADSHVVPDNDDINEHDQYSGQFIMEKQLVEIEKPSHHVRSISHRADHVNSRQVPYSYRRPSDISHHGQDHQIKEYCTKTSSTTNTSSKDAGTGLLNFVSGNFSRAHELLDGRPAVVATAPHVMNSTTTNTATPKTGNRTLLVPDNYSNQHSQSDPLASYRNKANHSDQYSPKLAPTTTAKRSKRLIDIYCCCNGEAIVPSFSVCSNDPSTTQDDSQACPAQSVEEEPQLPPPPVDKAPPTPPAKRKHPTTTAVHNLYKRSRRDKINKKMRTLQALIPNCSKAKKASILDEAIKYTKTLQLQLQMMSMGTGVMPRNPVMPGNVASPHLGATFALPSPTFHMLGFPSQPAASFFPLSIRPSLPLIPPSILPIPIQFQERTLDMITDRMKRT